MGRQPKGGERYYFRFGATVKVYNLGEMRRRVRGGGNEEGCGCHSPAKAREVAEQIAERVGPRRGRMGEKTAQKPPKDVDPILLTAGKGSKCQPFLVVNKDPAKFAAWSSFALAGPR